MRRSVLTHPSSFGPAAADGPARAPLPADHRRVILASSLGTVFEWYDFYLFGALAPLIARRFFGIADPSSAFALALLAFAAGFVVRPLGALLFGRLGDLIGRKYTFLVSIVVMGLSTFTIGLLPSHDAIGLAAPVFLVGLRLLQGLALGGEYGGAATYVAEHAPRHRRGAYTAWIQTTATLGLLASLAVIVLTRALVGEAAFEDWGWRVPFLLSAVMLALSSWIRLRMDESPAYQRLQNSGRTSRAPLREAFTRWGNLRLVLLALFGLLAGQAVVWYTGQLYALYFLHSVLKVDTETAAVLVAVALAVAAPFFVLFGAASDRFGRKPVIGTGLLLACLGLFPLFEALTQAANPALAQAQARVPVVLRADASGCSFQGNPLARDADFTSPCDIARRALTQASVVYAHRPQSEGQPVVLQVGDVRLRPPAATLLPAAHRFDNDSWRAVKAFQRDLQAALQQAGYPAEPPRIGVFDGTWWQLVALLSLMGIVVAMVYGPTAAALVELFPTSIRYTSMSLPYHLGNGWFGGLVPTIAFALAAGAGHPLQGLWYPVAVAAFTLVVGALFLPETRGRELHAVAAA